MYNINSADSIIDYAKLLKDQTLRTACDVDFNEYKINDPYRWSHLKQHPSEFRGVFFYVRWYICP